MNEVLKDKLRVIADDELMMRALKRAVDDKIERNQPDIHKTDDNQILGEKFRATEEAKKILKQVLMDIASYGDKKSKNKTTNKGR